MGLQYLRLVILQIIMVPAVAEWATLQMVLVVLVVVAQEELME